MFRFLNVLVHVTLMFLPCPIKNWTLNRIFGHQLSSDSKIGFSYVNVKKIVMKNSSKIGHFNIIKNISSIELGTNSSIGSLNYISCVPLGSIKNFANEKDRFPSLSLDDNSGITGRHYFDCNNRISIGKFTIVAGIGSTFLTHGINIADNKQETKPIYIGDYCMIGSNVVLVKGAKLPSYSILSAGSVLAKSYHDSYQLYSGVPASPVKDLPKDSSYFSRRTRFVP